MRRPSANRNARLPLGGPLETKTPPLATHRPIVARESDNLGRLTSLRGGSVPARSLFIILITLGPRLAAECPRPVFSAGAPGPWASWGENAANTRFQSAR